MSGDQATSTLEEARGLAAERRWPDLAALACPVPNEGLRAYPELAFLLGDALRRVGELEGSSRLAAIATEGVALNGDVRLRLRVENLAGMIRYDEGDMEAARSAFELLLQHSTEAEDDEFAARASNNLGVIASVRGDRELALTAYQRAIAAYQRLGHARGLAQTHYNVAIVYRDLGFYDETDGNLALAYGFASDAGHEDVGALIETERALLLATRGDGAPAEKLADRALSTMRRLGDPLGAANAVRVLAIAAEARGDTAVAMQRLDEALTSLERFPDLLLRAEIQRDRARLLLAAGDPDAARDALTDALATFEKLGARREAAATSLLLSRLS